MIEADKAEVNCKENFVSKTIEYRLTYQVNNQNYQSKFVVTTIKYGNLTDLIGFNKNAVQNSENNRPGIINVSGGNPKFNAVISDGSKISYEDMTTIPIIFNKLSPKMHIIVEPSFLANASVIDLHRRH